MAEKGALAMKRLNIYLNFELIRMICMVSGGLLLLFLLFDLFAQISQIEKNGYRLIDAFIYIILLIPSRLYEQMPIAVLIGTIFALSLLNSQSEIGVIRTSGVSLQRMVLWMTQTGVLWATITFLLGEYMVPFTAQVAEKWKLETTKSVAVGQFNSGIWIKDKQAIINIQSMLPDMTLQTIRMYYFDKTKRLAEIRDVEKGIYEGNQQWKLINNKRTKFLPNNAGVQLEEVPELTWRTEISPAIFTVLMVPPNKMSIFNLYHSMNFLERNHQKIDQYKIAFWDKLFYPLVTAGMIIIALPFCFANRRSGNVGLRVFSGIMVGLGFYFSSQFSGHIGQLYNWPPMITAILPLFLFVSGSLFFLIRQEKR